MKNLREINVKIAVIGDLMIDHYLWGKCERISPEAPVQVIEIQKTSTVPGGAGNAVNNLVALGANVCVYGVIGDDESGEVLEKMFHECGVDALHLIKEPGRITSKKSRVISAHQQVIRFDDETKEEISNASEEEILSLLKDSISCLDIILLSDYGKGVLTPQLTQDIISLANKNSKLLLADPKGHDFSKYKGATLLAPNRSEAALATGLNLESDEGLLLAGQQLKNELDLTYSIITLSEEGIAIFDNKMVKIPAIVREVYDVTGAGDTVMASLCVALGAGLDIYEACRFANKAAAVVVGKLGSATVNLDEIDAYERLFNKSISHDKIKELTTIGSRVKKLKEQGKKIVFTNGCFDILHRGHAVYLERAKKMGDILIVGVNSDKSVKRLKGENRPVNIEADRAYLLAALACVDFVVIFDEDTPYDLIKAIKPDVLVKGGDYDNKEVVGSDIVKEVQLISFVDGKSTTGIIKSIQGDG